MHFCQRLSILVRQVLKVVCEECEVSILAAEGLIRNHLLIVLLVKDLDALALKERHELLGVHVKVHCYVFFIG